MKKTLLIAGALAFAGSLSAQIFSEDFEGGTMPTGWAVTTLATDGGWNVGAAATLGSNSYPFTGNTTQFAGTNDDACNCDKSNDFLTSPAIDLTGQSGSVFLSFKQYFFALSYSGAQEVGTIEVSSDGGASYSILSQMIPVNEWETAAYDLSAYAGQTIMIGFRYNDGAGWTYGMGVDDISVYAPADKDVTLNSIDLPNFTKLGASGGVAVKGSVTNNAGVAITSMDVEYTIDGGTAVVDNMTGLNIAPLTSYDFTHATAWVAALVGDYAIEIKVTAVNGAADADITNNVLSQNVIVYENSYPRTVLYETFTSSTCGPCVAGNINFEGIVANIPSSEFASIKYQMSWPGAGDPYNTADGNTVRGYYAINSVPRLEADGGWDGNSGSFTMGVHTDALQVPAFVSIYAEYNVDIAAQKVTTCATITAMEDMGDATLHIAIKEFETFQNVGSNGETEFLNVLKKMVPDANGQTVTITKGMSQQICEEYTFKGSFRLPNDASDLINDATEHSVEGFDDLGVVVWLQNNATKEVYNATNGIDTPLSTKNLEANVATVSVFPNPAVNNTTISIVSVDATIASVRIMDIVGKAVINMANVNLSNGNNNVDLNTATLDAGVYLIEVTINGEVSTSQLVIQK